MNKLKSLFVIVGFIFSLFIFVSQVKASDSPLPVVIIHQIRGYETCCLPGDLQMISQINENENLKELPLAWAVRYDALNNEELVNTLKILPKQQQLGILLEITPQLASASGITYKGKTDGSDWYNGRNVFLIGYTPEARKKLIDTVFQKFHQIFGFYPTLTVGWMTDAGSLEYLKSTYGVRVHEITKEQYETDSYTLYGGIFNLPYYASKTHPLIPAKDTSDSSQILILRQTVSDIIKNYGSSKSFYTSQPNDYLSLNTNDGFSYFSNIIDTANSQENNSKFAVLGLENSQEWGNYKQEYLKQLTYLWELQKNEKIKIYSPDTYYLEYSGKYQINPVRILKSPDFPQSGVLWFFGKSYRARIEIISHKPVLTDFRIFTNQEDPYLNQEAIYSRAYWVLPYLIDSSQEFYDNDQKNDLFAGGFVRSDAGVTRFGIDLLQSPIKSVNFDKDTLTLEGESQSLKLMPEMIQIENQPLGPVLNWPINLSSKDILEMNTDQYFSFPRHLRFFMAPQKQSGKIDLGWENKSLKKIITATFLQNNNTWQIIPNVSLTQSEIDSMNAIWQPDKTDLPFDRSESTFFWHNTQSLAGKSPVRLFIDPRNKLGRIVAIKNLNITVLGSSGININGNEEANILMEPLLIDFTASISATAKVLINVDGNLIEPNTQIKFVTNCPKDIFNCLRNKENLKDYLQIIYREKLQQIKTYLNNLISFAENYVKLKMWDILPKINIQNFLKFG